MYKDFILTDSENQIKNEEIKERYHEAITCFNIGCYNATIVVLYTTMLYDMVLKLEKLYRIYNNENAKVLLDEIKEKTRKEPPDSSWEKIIIDKFFSEFKIISITEKNELLEFQRQRHYSAHPVLLETDDSETILIKNITKETALDCVRKVYDYILSKDAIIGTTKILEKIIIDADDYILRNNIDEFKKYISSRYLDILNEEMIVKLYLLLIKLVFSDTSKEAKFNRTQNALFLEFINEKYLILLKILPKIDWKIKLKSKMF